MSLLEQFPAVPVQVLCDRPDLRVEYVQGAYPLLSATFNGSVRTWGGVYASTLVPRFREWIKTNQTMKITSLLPEVAL